MTQLLFNNPYSNDRFLEISVIAFFLKKCNYIVIILTLFITTISYGQKNKLDSLTSLALDKANTFKEFLKIKEIYGHSFKNSRLYRWIPSINPLNPKKLYRISSDFGQRFHPISGKKKRHLGIDISAKAGTPIHAAADGTITTALKSKKGYGNQVIIKHKYGFKTRYGHMYLFIVQTGMTVKKGDIIGFVGNTGYTTGNHIHYEIIKNGAHIDPYPFLKL